MLQWYSGFDGGITRHLSPDQKWTKKQGANVGDVNFALGCDTNIGSGKLQDKTFNPFTELTSGDTMFPKEFGLTNFDQLKTKYARLRTSNADQFEK